MRTEEKLMLCTVSELSEFLASKIDGRNVLGNVFPDCDFSIIDSDCDMENESLECIASGANAWYGVKAIDSRFDNDCLMLISDYYYGGGCASMATFFDDYDQYYSISDTIRDLILETLNCFETAVTKDTLLIVEIR